MKRRGDPTRTTGGTKLARMRLKRGYSQQDLAHVTGIGLRTYQRLEAGAIEAPRLWYLVNCAVALDCSVEELVEDEYLRFFEVDGCEHYWVGEDPRGKTAGIRKAR